MESVVKSNSNKFKALFLAALGNFLEVYNYVLFATMLPVISPLFFPAENESVSIFLGFLTFAVAFLVAPIGSVFWGWIGDIYGRHALLRYSIIIMAIPTIAIGIIPVYSEIGVVAPALLVFLRILQGISASGGIAGAKIFALDHMGSHRFGITSGIITASGGFGVLMAWLIGLYIISSPNPNELWRYPFLLGGALYFVSMFIRKFVKELEVTKKQLSKNSGTKIYEIATVLADNKFQSLTVFLLGGMMGILSYTLHAFVTPFVIHLGFHKNTAYTLAMFAIFATCVSAIFAGLILDKKTGSLIRTMKLHLVSIISLAPVFWLMLLSPKIELIIFGYLGLGYLLGVFGAISGVMMYNVFPPHLRCRGTMLNNSLGIAIFGGLTPVTFDILSKLNPLIPALIISLYAAILFVFYKKLISKFAN